MVKAIKNYIVDLKLNFHIEFITFLLHRITGIALAGYLFLHIWTLSSVRNGEDFFNINIEKYSNPVGYTLEYLLLLCVLVHTINGVRIIIGDFLLKTRKQKVMWVYGVIIFLAITLFSIPYFYK
jgi:succinate dehydrogenase / fumarate reductase cytochrome b subunit